MLSWKKYNTTFFGKNDIFRISRVKYAIEVYSTASKSRMNELQILIE